MSHENLHQQSNDDRIVQALEKLHDAFKYLLRKKGGESGLSPLQIQVLMQIDKRRSCGLSDLARALKLSKPTIVDTLRSLETKNYIVKQRQIYDSRSFGFALTAQGQQLHSSILNYSAPFKKLLASLAVGKKNMLQLTLLQLIDRLQTENLLAENQMCFSCRYYHGDKEARHYCNWLNTEVGLGDLQLHCPEYKKQL